MWCKKTINFSGKTRDLLRCLKKYNRQETFFTSSNGHSLIKKASHSCYYVDHYIYHVTWRPFWNGSILRVFCVCYQFSAPAFKLAQIYTLSFKIWSAEFVLYHIPSITSFFSRFSWNHYWYTSQHWTVCVPVPAFYNYVPRFGDTGPPFWMLLFIFISPNSKIKRYINRENTLQTCYITDLPRHQTP